MRPERPLNPPHIEDPDADPALERIRRDRRPGEVETGMMTGSDDAEISATDRFEGELTEEEALEVLDPGHTRSSAAIRE